MKPGIEARKLELGGITPFSSVDFPGKLAAVLFCQGCPLRCRYCHNTHLQEFRPGCLPWSQALAFLESRRGLLDAVVFSGGEALAQAGLEQAMREVRALGFQVGLHTAGTHLPRLRRVVPLCDWIGLDIKAPSHRYGQVCGRNIAPQAFAALSLLQDSGIGFEIRTTVDFDTLTPEDLLSLAEEIAGLGIEQWVLQGCRDKNGESGAPVSPSLIARIRESVPRLADRTR